MNNKRNTEHYTKCLCGKGEVHSFFNYYSQFHGWIACPDCSRKYNVTPFGLLPRHIPVKQPKNQLSREIGWNERTVHEDYPHYGHKDIKEFLTEEELKIVYDNRESELGYLLSYSRSQEAWNLIFMVQYMGEWAYLYTKRELLMIYDALDDSVWTEESERFERKYHLFKTNDLLKMLRRTIIDYEKHKPYQEKWKQDKMKAQEKLQELYQRRTADEEALKQVWKEQTIPWDQLESL